MLKSRLLTALILIPLVIASIFFLTPLTFLSVALFVFLLSAWEWAKLSGFHSVVSKSIYIIILAALVLTIMFFDLVPMVAVAGLLWWLIAIVLLILYPKVSAWGKSHFTLALMGFFVLIPCLIALVILQNFSPVLLLFCLVLIWGVDAAAYFVGRKWGNHKMVPSISPGKSYEGLLAGMVASLVIAAIGWFVLEVPAEKTLLFFAASLVGGGIISVIGDLFESMIKRQSHVKDSGTLLPGHGGILDRIDSLTTAIPFFALVFPYLLSA